MFLDKKEIIKLGNKIYPYKIGSSDIPQYRIFELRYLSGGWSDTTGYRMKIIDERNGHSQILNRNDDKYKNSIDQAVQFLKSKRVEIIGYSAIGESDYLLSKDFSNWTYKE